MVLMVLYMVMVLYLVRVLYMVLYIMKSGLYLNNNEILALR